MKKKVILILTIIILGVVILGLVLYSLHKKASHDAIGGKPELIANAKDLKATIVTPHLEQEIVPGKNILWCATFQLAWNELCALSGGPVQLDTKPQMADVLNKKTVTKGIIDEPSYVAMAGFNGEGIAEKIKKELNKKFHGQESPELLAVEGYAAYAYMFKNLPFEWAFERLKDWPLEFAGKNVESFGISQYLTCQENEVKAASQLLIYDFINEANFIIELKNTSETDRLILALIPPGKTLEETIITVQNRIKDQKPENIVQCQDLRIPVIDFKIIREYTEVYGTINSKNPKLNNLPIGIATQITRFKLDEKGAVLKSEAAIALGGRSSMVFAKPFLVMLKRKDKELPYFALWVDNAELLVPYKKKTKEK